MDRLRVLSLNIWNKQGPYEARLPLLRAELAQLSPDLVGLQEVLRLEGSGSDGDQAAEVSVGLGYQTAFASAWHIGGGLHFGNGVLSRWPILTTESWQLPVYAGHETRGLLYALVDAPFGRVPFFVTHLDWQFHLGAHRELQVAFIADQVERVVSSLGECFPAIVAGDFNAEPDSDEIRFLSGLHSLGGRSVYFADCFRVAGSGLGAGPTYARSNRFAAEVGEPDRRIDYVWVRGPDKKLRGQPLACRVVANQPTDDVFPSDHYGVLADLKL